MKRVVFIVMLLCSFFFLSKENGFVKVESDFCKKSIDEGLKKALKLFCLKDSLFIGTRILQFNEYMNDLEDGKKIKFYPDSIYSSSSSDLGFTFGIYEEKFYENRKFCGYYLNFYKFENGKWRIFIQLKNPFPQHIEEKVSTEVKEIVFTKKVEAKRSANDVEREILSDLEKMGMAKVYKRFADKELIRLKSFSKAERGGNSAFLRAVGERGGFKGKIEKSFISKDKVFAVFVGKVETTGPQVKGEGSFLHILRLDEEGNYKLLFDAILVSRNTIKKEIL